MVLWVKVCEAHALYDFSGDFMKLVSKFCSIAILFSAATAAQATDCSKWPRFSSSEAYLKPLSVPAEDIGEFLTASKFTDGIVFNSTRHDDEIWLDIKSFPGTTSAATATRSLMIAGRLMDENFKALVLEDDGKPIFSISQSQIRYIGCRFIWDREGGENPIALIREFYKALSWYPGGRPISTNWTGSLIGDTSLAVSLGNEVVMPQWAISALD